MDAELQGSHANQSLSPIFFPSQMERGRGRFFFSLMCLVALTLGGCARLKALAGGGTTASLPTFQVGIVGAALGPGGVEGSYSANGAQLAIDAINAQGGVVWQGQHYQLTPTYSGAPAVVDRVRDFISRTPTVVALLGPDESDAAVAALPLITSGRIPTLTLALDDSLSAPAKNPPTPSLFRLRPPQAAWVQALANYVVQHANGPIALANIDSRYGLAGLATLTTALAAARVTPATQVTLPAGMDDASQQVNTILAARASTVVCWSTEAEAATLLHALHAAGWQGQFLLGQVDADFIALAGADGDGVMGLQAWSPTLPDAASQAFVAAYTRRFGTAPDEHAAAMYDAVRMLAIGLASVGPDHDALTHFLTTLPTYQGVTGPYGANPQGNLTTTLHLMQIEGGTVTPAG